MNLLFLAAIESISSARRHLEAGELRPCSDAIRRAWEIILKLSRSLDPSLDSDVKGSLESVFAYLRTRLMEANSQHSHRAVTDFFPALDVRKVQVSAT